MTSSPLLSRSSTLIALGLATLLAACGDGTQGPASCSSTPECGGGLVCTQNECLAPGQCPSTVQSCTTTPDCPASQDCQSGCCIAIQGCASSSDCVDTSRPTCDTSTHVCKPCTNSNQCAATKTCTPSGRCEPSCNLDTDCKTTTLPKCRTGLHYCAQCNVDVDCTGADKPICKDGACFGCTSNTSCGGATPVCDDASKACVACLESQNAEGKNAFCTTPATPACVDKTCAACAPSSNAPSTGVNGACPVSTAVCAPTLTCVGCTESSQCGGGVCTDQTCAAQGLATFTSPVATLQLGATITLTATLATEVVADTTINISIVSGGGTVGSDTIVITTGKTGTVTYTTGAVAGAVQLKASWSGVDKFVDLTVSDAALVISSLLPAALDVQAGRTAELTVKLSAQPAAATPVTLTSLQPDLATVPADVSVAGSDSATFAVTGVAAGAATIQASLGGVDVPATATVFAVTVASVTGPSGEQASGSTVTMTVTLSAAPPIDAYVTASADHGATIVGGADVKILASATTATFDVVLGSTGPVTVTAAANGSSQTASVAVVTSGTPPCAPAVVISGVYGGGGGTGTYKCDLIELHNRGASAQAIGGWSLQYASSTGPSTGTTTSATYKLPAVQAIPAGGYLLIKQDCGSSTAPDYGVGVPAATPDLVADLATTGSLSMAGGGGKVYLVSNQTAVTVSSTDPKGCPAEGSAVVDFLGWGGSSASPPVATTCSEGMHPGPTTDKTQAVLRNDAGCADTNDNLADFTMVSMTTGAPLRSSAAPAQLCSAICQ